MIRGSESFARRSSLSLALAALAALAGCGGTTPPPKVEEPAPEEPHVESTTMTVPRVAQELGSIDSQKVEQTFANLTTGPMEVCHKEGRARIAVLTGDVKVFLRIDGNGKMRYAYFEETTLGDRDTEKCILAVLANASWPKPDGGEAEVRSGFGWDPGGERPPTVWPSDKVTTALVSATDVRRNVDKCRGSVKGDFQVTAYVEADNREHGDKLGKHGKSEKSRAKPAKHAKTVRKEPLGKFKAIGVAPPTKDGADKVDCIVDALSPLELPSPGGYLAKVTFSL